MSTPDRFLKAFADYIAANSAGRLYTYAGYTGLAGALLLKDMATNSRVAIRPWLRDRAVGLQDVLRSTERYSSFRGQSPDIHVQVAGVFRENVKRFVQQGDDSTLITVGEKTVVVTGSNNLPKAVLEALLSFCQDTELSAEYDFVGTLRHRGIKGGVASAEPVEPQSRNPRLFVSYSWDGEQHKRWVLKLAADLIRNGVKVLIDEWDLQAYNEDLHLFMEEGIRNADHVLIVCTPTYAKRANERQGGVGVESVIITGEFFERAKASKFLPITRRGSHLTRDCLPSYLKTRYAIDFSDDTSYRSSLEELLRRLFEQPRFRRPDLGPVPRLRSEDV